MGEDGVTDNACDGQPRYFSQPSTLPGSYRTRAAVLLARKEPLSGKINARVHHRFSEHRKGQGMLDKNCMLTEARH